LINVSDNTGTLEDSVGNIVYIQYNGYEWKIPNMSVAHDIKFYPIEGVDTCNKIFQKYKTICGYLWDVEILPNRTPEYYRKIIYDLKDCINNRLYYSVSCTENTLLPPPEITSPEVISGDVPDPWYQSAISKTKYKLMYAKLYLSAISENDIEMYNNNEKVVNIINEVPDIYNQFKVHSNAKIVDLILKYKSSVLYDKYYLIFDIDTIINKTELLALLTMLIYQHLYLL
jgi:hypothetical protein